MRAEQAPSLRRFKAWPPDPGVRADIAAIALFFGLFLVVDRLTSAMATITSADLGRLSLVAAAVDRRPLLWLGATMAVVTIVVLSGSTRRRLTAPWSALEHGTTLRLFVAPLIVYLAWKGAVYPVNFTAGEVHVGDRVLLVALAAGALWRPLVVVPFVLQFRVLSAQTLIPFGTAAARNIGELPVIVVLLVGVGHGLFAITGRRQTSVVLLAVTAAVASHFYIPGKGKLLMGWLVHNDVANLPLASYTAGWLGHTDGSVAAAMASAYDRFGPMVKVVTLVIELGAVAAVAHRRLLRPWLMAVIVFHVATFITTGFFFVEWVLIEAALLMILLSRRPDLRSWVAENTTWVRSAVAVAATIGAPILFHPPGLAWFDAPVSYGYRLQGTGENGMVYDLPASVFAPFEQEILFKRLQLSERSHLSGAYGALESRARLDELDTIESPSDLLALEATQPLVDDAARDRSIEFLATFMRSTDDAGTRRANQWLQRFDPPSVFWSSSTDNDYDFGEPLTRIDVTVVTRVHTSSAREAQNIRSRTDQALTLVRNESGSVVAEVVAEND